MVAMSVAADVMLRRGRIVVAIGAIAATALSRSVAGIDAGNAGAGPLWGVEMLELRIEARFEPLDRRGVYCSTFEPGDGGFDYFPGFAQARPSVDPETRDRIMQSARAMDRKILALILFIVLGGSVGADLSAAYS
jgi:hypothetical protein